MMRGLGSPPEQHTDDREMSYGVWSFMISIVNLWNATRSFVHNCAARSNRSPWEPDSEHTWICSGLMDLESILPNYIRLQNTKFSERSVNDIHINRDRWLNWLHSQVTYHLIHSILNHPFLHVHNASRHPRGPNMFWRASSEAAALHSSWTVRMIDMALGKGLTLSDPFFAYAVAVAATLHFHFSHASDEKIRTQAETNLKECKSFLAGMATRWPLCQLIVSLHNSSIPRNSI